VAERAKATGFAVCKSRSAFKSYNLMKDPKTGKYLAERINALEAQEADDCSTVICARKHTSEIIRMLNEVMALLDYANGGPICKEIGQSASF
jgi:hypothetical protein